MKVEDASAALADIEAITRRVKQSAIYRASSQILMFWGVIVVCGDLFATASPRWSGWAWAVLDVAGAAMNIGMLSRVRGAGAQFPLRALVAFALFVAFGWVCSEVIGHFGPRQLDAFWPLVFLLGYALAGLWFGAAFTLLALALALLILAGFFWSGPWFTLYLALVNGGGLILCGYGMRRA